MASEKEGGISRSVVYGVIFAVLGGAIPAGHGAGVINAPHAIIQEWIDESLETQYGIHLAPFVRNLLWGIVVSLFVAGALVGTMLGHHMSDIYGRRSSLCIIQAVSVISSLLIYSCHFVRVSELFLIGRLLAGFAAGSSTSVGPIYLNEIAPPKLRGVMITLFPMGFCLGMLISQVLGLPTLLGTKSFWPVLFSGNVLYVIVAASFYKLTYESPTFLHKTDEEACKTALIKLRKDNMKAIEAELNTMSNLEHEESSSKEEMSFLKAFFNMKYFKLFLIVMVYNSGQQFGGINAVFNYSKLVFTNSGFAPAISDKSALCAGIPNLVMAVAALYLVRYFSRKNLMVVSLFIYGISLSILVFCVIYAQTHEFIPYLALMSLFSAIVGYGIGLGPVPYIIASELFAPKLRPLGIAVGAASNWGSNLMVGLAFPLIEQALGIYAFAIFISYCSFLVLFVCMLVPETFETTTDYVTLENKQKAIKA